jgi:hypothetical protein
MNKYAKNEGLGTYAEKVVSGGIRSHDEVAKFAWWCLICGIKALAWTKNRHWKPEWPDEFAKKWAKLKINALPYLGKK